ncbi:DNA polymerase processivity subunit [Pteropodid alphaherpesvirus 1]|uniref:DNA polymerase processivity factor n=1 Tax=Pteropodid alphaherpesvirus 1 TaxID=1343901 RepID=A0A060Q5A2_9ALPH|nr:DNA polymerase processivity subunit [Pteropodid alphaherpesvirus 1]BAP00721.1 DNA polymerase processivity subunit [Pteropodid alphaherpesvirus 1]
METPLSSPPASPATGSDITAADIPRSVGVLQGSKLNEMLRAFAPLRTSLLDSVLVFNDRGVLVQSSLFGEQVFLPLETSQFSRFVWTGPAAAFFSLVDQKRSLLSVFRQNHTPDIRRVEFLVSGQAPFRTLTQRVWTSATEEDASELASETLLKREVTSFVMMLPQGTPDVQLRLTKAQLSKILTVCAGDPTRTVFEMGQSGKFSVFTPSACITFAAREECFASPTSTQAQILSSALKKTGNSAAAAKIIYGDNIHHPFAVQLDSGSLKAILKRLQVGPCLLKFFLTEEVPSLCVTATDPNHVSVIVLVKFPPTSADWIDSCSSVEGLPERDDPSTDEHKPPEAITPTPSLPQVAPAADVTGSDAPQMRESSPTSPLAASRGGEEPHSSPAVRTLASKRPPVSVDAKASPTPKRPKPTTESSLPPQPPTQEDNSPNFPPTAGRPLLSGLYTRYYSDPPIIIPEARETSPAQPSYTRKDVWGPGFKFGK